MIKIATWNVNSLRVRLEQVLTWLKSVSPDVLALQEIKMEDHAFPEGVFMALGYRPIWSGQKTYNGVALLSRQPPTDVTKGMCNWPDEQQRVLSATIADIRVINLYVPNGEAITSVKYHYKLEWLTACRDFLQSQLKIYPQVVVVGDFNIAPADDDVHDPAAWQGQVLVSEPERQKLQELFALGLQDSFRLFSQLPGSYSWWDYRMGSFRRDRGLRIDHILVNDALARVCTACEIDKIPRAWERPSDHAPVIATFNTRDESNNE